MRRALFAAALLTTLALGAHADEADSEGPSFAITNCRVLTLDGPPIDGGIVIVENGKIVTVGEAAKVKLHSDLRVVDGGGGVLMPGFVHPTTRIGARGSGTGSTTKVAPTETVEQELNPWLGDGPAAAANGLTTVGVLPGVGIVGGQGTAVRTVADDVASMIRRKGAFLRVDVDTGPRFASTLANVLSAARKELVSQAEYDEAKAAYDVAAEKAKAEKKKPPKAPGKPKISKSNEPYRKVLEGEMALVVYVDDDAEVRALESALSDERVRGDKLRLYVRPGGNAPSAAPILADLGATCIVAPGWSTWQNTFDLYCPAVLLHEAGCRVVLISGNTNRVGLRAFRHELARVVRSGFPRDAALRAACRGGAEVLGLEKEIGVIAEGRRADLQLYSGDPLSPQSELLRVWIDGEPVEETP